MHAFSILNTCSVFPLGHFALLFLQFCLDSALFKAGQIFNKYLALKMIDFVLNAYGQQALRFKREVLPITTRCPNPDLLGALDLLIDARHRKTPFLAKLRSSTLDNLRIDEDLQAIAILRGVNNNDLSVYINLGRRQANSGRRIHGFRHIRDQNTQISVKSSHWRCFLIQARIGKAQNWQPCHNYL